MNVASHLAASSPVATNTTPNTMKTKLTLASLLLCAFALNAATVLDCGDTSPLSHRQTCLPVSKRGHARALQTINPQLAVKAIIGEAAGEGDTGMLAVAAAIRNRGTLRGVYGVKNPIAQNPSATLLKRAERAWALSRTIDITRGATHWENVRAFGEPYWAKSLTVTTNISNHRFYK